MAQYEIHITVEGYSFRDFIDLCTANYMKALVIDLENSSQMMTSSGFRGDEDGLVEELKNMWNIIDPTKVVRVKVEKDPEEDEPLKEYFECHLRVDAADIDKLDTTGYHVSRNSLSGTANKFLTKRVFEGTIAEFKKDVLDYVEANEQWINKVIFESVVYDSNSALDNKWMEK